MKKENDLLESKTEENVTLLNGKPIRVTGEEVYTMPEHTAKKTRLKALLAIVAGISALSLGTINIVMNQTDNYMGTEYYKYRTAPVIEEKRYSAPEGFVLEFRDGEAYATRTTTHEKPATVITTYSVPEGYVLEGTKGVKDGEEIAASVSVEYQEPEGWTLSGSKAIKTVTETTNAKVEIERKAPEGYVLIGDKCYKIAEPKETEEKTKGR